MRSDSGEAFEGALAVAAGAPRFPEPASDTQREALKRAFLDKLFYIQGSVLGSRLSRSASMGAHGTVEYGA
jgi:hypothetical protein